MAHALNLPNLREGYKTLVDYVLEHGKWVAPRGARTLEVLDVSVTVQDPLDLFPHGMGRRVRTQLLAADALQLVGGHQDPEQLFGINPGMRRFTDHGVFWGAYGPRIRPQLAGLQRKLESDLYTRRAVMTFWDPLRDGYVDDVQNYPCMTEVQFLVRDWPKGPTLHTFGRMRANDLWLGTTYDMFTLAQLGWTVANCFGLRMGPYHHHVTSLHLYEEHVERAATQLHEPEKGPLNEPRGFGYPGLTLEEAAARARMIGRGEVPENMTPSERWYLDQLDGVYGS